jgi:GNAT superfamily N-acetyltransferase
MEIEVRQVAPSEAPIVSEVLTEASLWLQSCGISWLSRDAIATSSLEAEVRAAQYYLAWSGKSAVGTMRLTSTDPLFWPEFGPGGVLYLHRLAVRRAASGGSVSSALLGWACSHASTRGARCLRLACDASQPRLRQIYERFGFSFHSECTIGTFIAARYEISCAHAA